MTEMIINDCCVNCLFDKQKHLTDNEEYLKEIKAILDGRSDNDTAPYMVYLFDKVYKRYFGALKPYGEVKKQSNDFVLKRESMFYSQIVSASDPVEKAFLYARVGNYIDFGAANSVDNNVFLKLFTESHMSEHDIETYRSFIKKCKSAKTFLLIADNSGEIVLDKLFLSVLKERFPNLSLNVLVRGGEALNDVTTEDACYVGIDKIAAIYTNGLPMSGTSYELLPADSKEIFDRANVILAKGQGNFETLSHLNRGIFFSFLCKCDFFVEKFKVPRNTGMFLEV